MQLELAQKIQGLALALDDEIEVRSYSTGRTKTTAIVGITLADVAKIVIQNADQFVDDDGDPLFPSINCLQSDKLGTSTIVY